MTPPATTRTRPGPLGTLTTSQRSHIANARPGGSVAPIARPLRRARTRNADLTKTVRLLMNRAQRLLAHPRIMGTEAHRYCATRVQYMESLPGRFAAAGSAPGAWKILLPRMRDRLEGVILPRLEAAEREGRSWATRDGYLPAVQRDWNLGPPEII